ncbi:hypothetical protein NC651_036719 [Populus alba x Populus x berolinensis]|nr:hypothetical protein NC651_036719 [Populus alba x Populus x berolinensis]
MCFDDALEKENERLEVQRLQANLDARSMQSHGIFSSHIVMRCQLSGMLIIIVICSFHYLYLEKFGAGGSLILQFFYECVGQRKSQKWRKTDALNSLIRMKRSRHLSNHQTNRTRELCSWSISKPAPDRQKHDTSVQPSIQNNFTDTICNMIYMLMKREDFINTCLQSSLPVAVWEESLTSGNVLRLHSFMLVSLHLSYCLCFEREEYEHGLLRGVNIGGMLLTRRVKCPVDESIGKLVLHSPSQQIFIRGLTESDLMANVKPLPQ